MIQSTEALAQRVPVIRACKALGYPRSSLYHARRPKPANKQRKQPTPARALSESERTKVRDLLNGERFQDNPPLIKHLSIAAVIFPTPINSRRKTKS